MRRFLRPLTSHFLKGMFAGRRSLFGGNVAVAPGGGGPPGPTGNGLVWGASNYFVWGAGSYLVWG